jgi:prepilin-type N-terminal cleavage/methylation domain-containing protein
LKRGFSLIELLVALGLLSVVMLFVFNSFSYQNATYTVVDQVSEVQQNSNAVGRLIERDIRNAGYMVPPAAAACGIDSTTAPDMLFLSDADVILPADQLTTEYAGKELGARITADPSSTGVTTLNVDSTIIDGTASYDTNADGTNDSDFRVGGGAILIDRGNSARGVSCGLVTAVNPGGLTVTVNLLAVLGTTAPLAKDLRLVPAHVYQIVTGGGAPSRLTRDGVLLAKDVEDVQVAWFFDTNQNSAIDAGEMRGDGVTAYSNSGITGDQLREIRVNLVTATRTNDPRYKTATAGIGQPRENRTAASSPGADGKHRRVSTATVRLRNLTL